MRTATTFKDISAKDFRERDMMISVFDFGFSGLRLLANRAHQSLIILRANRAAAVKRHDSQLDARCLCSPSPL